jgi:IS5 family transposase
MVKVAAGMDRDAFETALEQTWHPELGRPGVSTRLMVSLKYLKYVYDLSDEEVLELWVENPYWQHLCGMKFFEHQAPIEASSLSRWRTRLAKVGAEKLLEETLKAGLRMKLIPPRQLERINVGTTVQEKHVRFPTESRLYDRARTVLVSLAKRSRLKLRQSYERVGKQLMLKQSRYAHARQYKRAGKCGRHLKTLLGRVIRDIQRNCPEPEPKLREELKQAGKTWLYIRWVLNQAEIQLHMLFNPNTALYPRSLN